MARRIAHSFQKNKTQKLFIVVAIDIGDISFFFLGLLLTVRYGYHLFVINGFNKLLKGMLGFVIVGLLAGIFGLGAGWANVAILNLVMGAPVKVAVATSSFALSITDSTAAWIYMNKGAVLPMLTVPSMIGIMLGAKIGSKLLPKVKPSVIRNMVIGVLFFAGVRSLMKAFGI